MKFTVKSSLLKNVISNLESLYSTALDTWDMEILLSAQEDDKGDEKGGSLLIECSGGGSYYKQTIPAQVDKKGKVAVNVTFLKSINLPGETVTFLIKDKGLSFASGRMTGKLETIGDKDPITRPKSFEAETALKMPAKLFSRLVSSILFSPTVSDQTMKMRFLASKKKSRLRVFCIDQYRLAKYEYQKPQDGEEEPLAPKEKEKTKGKAKKEKKGKKAEREVMVAEVLGDFDYVFSSDILSAIKGFFTGDLKISADSKHVKMEDEHVTLYCPSLQEDIGGAAEKSIKELEEQKTLMEMTFLPSHASDLIEAACSVNKNDDNRITMVPKAGEKQVQVKVTGEGVKTQCTFDVLSIEAGKDSKVVLNATYFLEFLDLVKGFSDDKNGCGLKVWEKGIALHTPSSFYLMSTVS
jgi:DNA polymerase III sliding clamp (beta) subunit (PCNA family)